MDAQFCVLGIETSCDETGIAIYGAKTGLVAHALHSQSDLHTVYGGVVPELASRDHLQRLIPLLKSVLQQANLTLNDLGGIAYTAGPGLIGALLVGACFARSLSFALAIPSVAIHHLEGHLLAPMLESDPPAFPFLALLVSGGHTQLIHVESMGHYQILGDTLDDAVGEAFDKSAKLLGLGYPGGSALAALAEHGRAGRFRFPRPMVDRPGLDFSFSGLKTAVAQAVASHFLDESTRADVAYAFQEAAIDTLVVKCRRALQETQLKRLVIAGGVSANHRLRQKLQTLVEAIGANLYVARPEFCTDNGAMIAYAGYQRLLTGSAQDLTIQVYPRWALGGIDITHPL